MRGKFKLKKYYWLITSISALLSICNKVNAQNLCDASSNPNYIANGFQLLTPAIACAPYRVKLKDNSGGTDVKYIYYYQGQDKSELNALGPTNSLENTYFKPEVTSNYTILQYGKDENGKEFYSCKNLTINSSNTPSFTYSICSSGIELVIPKDDINSIYSEFKIDVLNSGFTKHILKNELPITLNIPMNYPDELKIEGIETGQPQASCNLVSLKIDPNSNPKNIDAPFDINIDTLELVDTNRARITFTGSLAQNGYTLQMRESKGDYPFNELMKNVIPKKIEVELPNPNQSYCFKLSRQMLCGGYEFSAEICTTPITKTAINKYGEITLDWINHAKPSTGQTFNQKKEIEINKIDKGISYEDLPLNLNSYSKSMSCGVNKVCFVISNKINGKFYNYQYQGTSISNEVCIISDSIIAPPISNLLTTVNNDELIDVFFEPNTLWETPVSKFFLHYITEEPNGSIVLDSSKNKLSFQGIQRPLTSQNCFSISYIDTCGIKSEKSNTACTVSLKNNFGSNLSWSSLSPFSDEDILEYQLFALNELSETFYEINQLQSFESDIEVDLSGFEDLALFKMKAISTTGQISFSNIIEVPLEFKLFIPEAFSPNNDGFNDEFKIFGTLNKIKDFYIKIFDREGQIVFESKSPEFKWNGIFNKVVAPKGTYNYYVSLTSQNEEQLSKQGRITLF